MESSCPARQAHVSKQVDRLATTIADLEGIVEQLEVRLAPILDPAEHARCEQPADPEPDPSTLAPHAAALGAFADRVGAATWKISSLINRVEL
jgi:hypothetical protein